MLADLEAGDRDAVLLYYLDRLTRQPIQLEDFAALCEQLGVRQVATVTTDVDLGNDGRLFMARIFAAFAVKESPRKAARIRRYCQQLAEEPKPNGGHRPCFACGHGQRAPWSPPELSCYFKSRPPSTRASTAMLPPRGGGSLHRLDWQLLAKTRLREARALANAGEWSGAYYLGGYVVEAGLKACFVRQFKAHTMPDKSLVQKGYTHRLEELVKLSGLNGALDGEIARDAQFETHWLVAKDWDAESRYRTWSQTEAEDLLLAVSSRTHGVLRWVRRHW